MNNFLQSILGMVSQGGGNGQMLDFALNWLFNQPQAIAICKAANWDIVNLKNAIKGGFSYMGKAYSERLPFAKTIEQRIEDLKKIYKELCGYECLDNMERSILSAKMAGFNAKEVHQSLGLENTMSVEQVISLAEVAQEKYLKVAKMAGVGANSSSVESSVSVNLKDIFKDLEAKKDLSDGAIPVDDNPQKKE